MGHEFRLIDSNIRAGVATATINNPPVNLMNARLFRELKAFGERCEADPTIRVVVLDSANPEFFIAHFDVERILRFPTDGEPKRSEDLNAFHQMCELYRTMPKATICKIAGRVGGGGSELAASCDMRFGVLGRTVVNQMEVPLGILPAGCGTQRLPRLIGRGRALEVILGGIDVDAATAEVWGYLNRAFMNVEDLDEYVDDLAARIAGYPPQAVALAKQAVLRAEPDWHDGLVEEEFLMQRLIRTPEAAQRMELYLELGGQTREGELRAGELNSALAQTRGW